MIRLILAVIAIVLYLILTIPVLWILKVRERKIQRPPTGAAFIWFAGFSGSSAVLPESGMRCGDWKIYPVTVRCFMWETTEAILIL